MYVLVKYLIFQSYILFYTSMHIKYVLVCSSNILQIDHSAVVMPAITTRAYAYSQIWNKKYTVICFGLMRAITRFISAVGGSETPKALTHSYTDRINKDSV
jgi:hypothetical protein